MKITPFSLVVTFVPTSVSFRHGAHQRRPARTFNPPRFMTIPGGGAPAAGMRAWTCHGRNQPDLVDRLRQAGIVRSDAVAAVMTATDRQYYVPRNSQCNPLTSSPSLLQPYQDSPIPIGLGQTISAPHMHAHALEQILPYVSSSSIARVNEPVKILDVGCGSGYLTACFGRWLKARDHATSLGRSILGRTGQVYGIDIHEHLVELTRSNLLAGQDGDLLLHSDTNSLPVVTLQTANGWEGLPRVAPFDVIHVGASAATLPVQLARQLKVGGVMIVPIGPAQGVQALYKVERLSASHTTTGSWDTNEFRIMQLLGVRYVPLIEQPSRPP